jgi:hypothetical protein
MLTPKLNAKIIHPVTILNKALNIICDVCFKNKPWALNFSRTGC